MYTVIIMDKAISKWIKEYKPLIDPFLKQDDVDICDWDEQGYSVSKALPDLKKLLQYKKEWRALFIIKPENVHKYNPFDYEEDKEADFDADNYPLIRITNLLNGFLPNESADDNRPKNYYMEIPSPNEIILLSPRIIDEEDYKLSKVGNRRRNEIVDASKFWRTNDYASTTRFLVYDIVGENHVGFNRDIIGFVSAAICLMKNTISPSHVQAYRLYNIRAEYFEEDFVCFCQSFYTKIAQNQEYLNRLISSMNRETFEKQEELNKENEGMRFDADNIETVFEDMNMDDFVVDRSGFGLANDCPKYDRSYFKSETARIYNSFEEWVKKQRIVLDKAINRAKKNLDNSEPVKLDKYNVQDLEKHNKKRCVEIYQTKAYDHRRYLKLIKSLRAKDMGIFNYLKKRMNKKTIITMGSIMLGLYAASFVLYYYDILSAHDFSFNTSFPVIGNLICISIIMIDYLYYLKFKLKSKLKEYNNESLGGAAALQDSFNQFGIILTKYTTYRINKRILDYQESIDDVLLNKKAMRLHVRGLDERSEMCRYWLKAFGCKPCVLENDEADIVDIEISPHECGVYYPTPNKENHDLELKPTSEKLYLPYSYIKYIRVCREEAYDL